MSSNNLIVDRWGYVYVLDEDMGMTTFLGLSHSDCLKPSGPVGFRESLEEIKDPKPYTGRVIPV